MRPSEEPTHRTPGSLRKNSSDDARCRRERLPSLPSALRLAPQTNYSAWATYEAQAAEAGLVLNATLQQALHGLTPAQMAEGDAAWPQRNFEALFTRASHDTVVR